jgi:hypothetical protein
VLEHINATLDRFAIYRNLFVRSQADVSRKLDTGPASLFKLVQRRGRDPAVPHEGKPGEEDHRIDTDGMKKP